MTNILQPSELIGGRYKIEAYVDAGGMQEVYRAYDMALQRAVALKVPKNNSAKKRFERSAAMSAKVTHPNVAKTFDYLVENDRQYLIEEFVNGQDLRSRLSSHYLYLDPYLAAHLFHHFAKGLADVHRVGVIHRDLKPSNVMVSTDPDIDVVKITDFGIAKMAEAEVAEALVDQDATLGSQTVVGALPYMAPEVIQNAQEVTEAADIWSAGAMLFHLLTGAKPFGDGLSAVEKILKAELPAMPKLLSSNSQFNQLTTDLWSIIAKCLVLKPKSRLTAVQLVDECGKLCYSRSPRSLGVVSSFSGGQGKWGFIQHGDPHVSAFFHASSYWGDPPIVGTRVSFAKFHGLPCERAHPVLPLRPE